jgi:hypothetical protein
MSFDRYKAKDIAEGKNGVAEKVASNLRKVAAQIASHANSKGESYPSHETIARETGLDIKTVRKWCVALKKLGRLVLKFHNGETWALEFRAQRYVRVRGRARFCDTWYLGTARVAIPTGQTEPTQDPDAIRQQMQELAKLLPLEQARKVVADVQRALTLPAGARYTPTSVNLHERIDQEVARIDQEVATPNNPEPEQHPFLGVGSTQSCPEQHPKTGVGSTQKRSEKHPSEAPSGKQAQEAEGLRPDLSEEKRVQAPTPSAAPAQEQADNDPRPGAKFAANFQKPSTGGGPRP